jgi:hypothetical protein
MQPERRRDPRTVTSVMSEVFTPLGRTGQLRYLAPAIILDISDSGLALAMDRAPVGCKTLRVRNYYFEVDVEIRNTTPLEVGFRVGGEFTGDLQWTEVTNRGVPLAMSHQ